jgi:hypothetical protein
MALFLSMRVEERPRNRETKTEAKRMLQVDGCGLELLLVI